jgi:hypothetical protein
MNTDGNREAHIILCPEDIHAQENAAEYIATLKPATVFMATKANAYTHETQRWQEQDLYDELTGTAHPSGLTSQLREQLPEAVSTLGLLSMVHGGDKDKAMLHLMDVSRNMLDIDIAVAIPYYRLAMGLRDSGISIVNVDAVNDPVLAATTKSPYKQAYNEYYSLLENWISTDNIYGELTSAVEQYRTIAREYGRTAVKSAIRVIKHLPSTTEPDEKIAVVTNFPNMIALRKGSYSKRVATHVRNFASLHLKDIHRTKREIFDYRDYMADFIDFGLGIEGSPELKLRLDRVAENGALFNIVGHYMPADLAKATIESKALLLESNEMNKVLKNSLLQLHRSLSQEG